MRGDIDFDRLGITDDLMFGTVFQDPNLCQGLIELLLGIQVEKIEFVERQGLLDAGPLSRAGIVDLLVRDAAGNEYDVEMQNVATPGIARRARRYLTLVDANMLDRGQRFEDAGDAIMIFICANDPFGRGWKRYDFMRTCAQDGQPMDDGTSIVFVNAAGTRGDYGDGFDAFLRYLSNDTVIESDYVRSVDDAVRGVRDNPQWRRYRMLWSEKYRDEIADAMDEGRAEGEAIGARRRDEQLARLARALEGAGRAGELAGALGDEARLGALLREFDVK
jgi:predicted transposase/invertase (TIGR01784 family)